MVIKNIFLISQIEIIKIKKENRNKKFLGNVTNNLFTTPLLLNFLAANFHLKIS